MTVKKKEKDRQKEIKERETYVKNEKRKEKERNDRDFRSHVCLDGRGVGVADVGEDGIELPFDAPPPPPCLAQHTLLSLFIIEHACLHWLF